MPNRGIQVAGYWSKIQSLTDDTSYDVQNIGDTNVYLIEVDDTDTEVPEGHFINANVLPPFWGTSIKKTDTAGFWVKGTRGGGRLTINEAGD